MAVYTHVDAGALAAFLARYDIGTAVSFKGIAEGVENSNYFVETTGGRFILTLYEKRVDVAELPYFLDLMTHCADRGLRVPRPIRDRVGVALQALAGRPACLIEFVKGVSVTDASTDDARAVGVALGGLHRATQGFTRVRANTLGVDDWKRLHTATGKHLDTIEFGLEALVADQLEDVARRWPTRLERSTIHADLFPDNVLMLDGEVTGLIDFYFACNEIRAYDIAVTHAAWCFSNDGTAYFPDRAAALVEGYRSRCALSVGEIHELPILCRGAALRFLLTRAYDWLNTPADALVTRKDPLAFARRLEWYASAAPEQLLGG